MGAFYGSIQVRSEDREAVKAAVEEVARECRQKFLLGPPINGWIGIYPDESGESDVCAKALAKRLKNILLQLIVHDDSAFIYNFFRDGELLNEHSSCPDYFQEVPAAIHAQLKAKPEIFRDLVESPEKYTQLCRLLGATEEAVEFTFESERLEEIASLLGMANTLTSYEYLMDGERDDIQGWKQFTRIPDVRAAEKAAAEALRREKLAWQKAGLLANEWLPPCAKKDAGFWATDICPDSVNGGFLVLWRRSEGSGAPPDCSICNRPGPPNQL